MHALLIVLSHIEWLLHHHHAHRAYLELQQIIWAETHGYGV